MLLEQRSQKEKEIFREKSNAFTNMPWGWIDLQGWERHTHFPPEHNDFQKVQAILAKERQLDK